MKTCGAKNAVVVNFTKNGEGEEVLRDCGGKYKGEIVQCGLCESEEKAFKEIVLPPDVLDVDDRKAGPWFSVLSGDGKNWYDACNYEPFVVKYYKKFGMSAADAKYWAAIMTTLLDGKTTAAQKSKVQKSFLSRSTGQKGDQTMAIKICRPDGTHKHDHFWNTTTGKTVKQSKETQHTSEQVCQKHSGLSDGNYLTYEKAMDQGKRISIVNGKVVIKGETNMKKNTKTSGTTNYAKMQAIINKLHKKSPKLSAKELFVAFRKEYTGALSPMRAKIVAKYVKRLTSKA
jgi:hypothetical protein